MINWTQLLVALGLAVVVGAGFMAAGMWLDLRRDRRWNRELNAPAAAPGDDGGA
jgi:hypothetical protein